MTSKLKFRFHDTDLNSDEAAALLTITKDEETPIIDLSKIIKITARNASEMFDLAIKQKNPALANLAAKFAMASDASDRTFQRSRRRTGDTNKQKSSLEVPIEGSIENIIDKLHRREARWAAGVASILMFAPDGPDENNTLTIKEIAVEQNRFLKLQRVNPNCIAFRGFVDGIKPLDSTGIARNESFFTSPTYNALREGLIFCKANNLVVLRQGVSVGSLESSPSEDTGNRSHLQRTYFSIQLAERGIELFTKWGDIGDYLSNFWSARLS